MREMSKKVCMLGEFAVGKTSLVRRFVYDRFGDKYLSTIGVKVSRKMVPIVDAAPGVSVTLLLWDLAGGEKFDQLRATYLRGSAGALLVCDLTRMNTLLQLERYAAEMRSMNPRARFVVAANKIDAHEQHQMDPADVRAAAERLGAPYHLTSAKSGDRVAAAFRQLASMLVEDNRNTNATGMDSHASS